MGKFAQFVGWGLAAFLIWGLFSHWEKEAERKDRWLRISICQYNNLPLERCYPTMRRRLTEKEWDVLLDAANAYEAEPANFEEDPDDKRLEALRSAIRKMQGKEKA